jgi:hypothetical protein
MKIRNVIHKGLRRFIERNEPAALPPASVEKVRNIITLQETRGSRFRPIRGKVKSPI